MKWINVKDQLPEENEKVLVYIKDDEGFTIAVTHWYDDNKYARENKRGKYKGSYEKFPIQRKWLYPPGVYGSSCCCGGVEFDVEYWCYLNESMIILPNNPFYEALKSSEQQVMDSLRKPDNDL